MLGVLEQNIDRLKSGWRMVPREPTDEMLASLQDGFLLNALCKTGDLESYARLLWRRMFDAFQASA
jgi:hypothetical protein